MKARFLTPAQVAERLQVSPLTVLKWLRSGRLKGVKAGKLWRVEEEALEAFVVRPETEREEGTE